MFAVGVVSRSRPGGLERRSVISLSLPLLLLDALLVSAVLMILRQRGAGAAASAAAAIGAGAVLALLPLFVRGAARGHIVRHWLLFVCAPTAVLFLVSRASVFNGRPWLLLILGPISFVAALVLMTIVLNVWFAPGQST